VRRILWLGVSVFSIIIAGCGDDHAVPADASNPPMDAPADAPPDAPPDGSVTNSNKLIANDGAGTITQWTAPNTFAGATSTDRLFIINSGATTTSALSASITGTDASSFAIVTAGTTCSAPLAAGDMCVTTVRYAPATAGSQNAVLDVATGDGHLLLPLTGTAPATPTTDLTANLATVDFGSLTSDEHPTVDVILTNASGASITLGARTTAAPFSVVDNCPTTLTPGGACTATVTFQGAPLGSSTGMLHVASSANSLDVPLQGIVLRDIKIQVTGIGTGRVVSLPAGIDCPNVACGGGFPLGIDVQLIPSHDANNIFAGWGGLCTGQGTCVVASPHDGTVSVQFMPSTAKKITITEAGSSPSFATVVNSSMGTFLGRCAGSCVVYVAMNTQVTLNGFSPSTFAGWSGDCVSATSACNLGTVTSDRNVTITSNPDANEVATLLPSTSITGLAVAPGGNIVFATDDGVTELSVTGTVVWTTAVSGASSLAVDGAGNVYGMGGSGVFALTSAGALAWTRTFTGAAVGGGSLNSSVATSPDGTVIAVLTADGVHVVNGSGVDRFTITSLSPAPQTVAVAPDGTVGLVQFDASLTTDQTQALRYTSSGTALTSLAPIPGNEFASIAFDSSNSVCAVSTGFGEINTSRTTSALVNVFTSATEHDGFAAGTPAGVLVTSGDHIIAVRQYSEQPISGMKIQDYSQTGTVLLTQSKPPQSTSPLAFFDDGDVPLFIAAGGTNRVAIAGMYGYTYPWIQVFDLP